MAKATKAATGGSRQNVEYVLPVLNKLLKQYTLIRDVIEGEPAVKDRGKIYLPMPDPTNLETDNVLRYDAYKTRAVFYGVTKRTLQGLVGQVMLVDPVIEVPPLLDPVVKDANGSGVTIVQLAEVAERYVLAYGRAGVFADYPVISGETPVTLADQQAGRVRPTITLYSPFDIINWRTRYVGSERVLSLVVLRETYVEDDDGFEEIRATQYRVLRLINGIYRVEIWRGETGAYKIYNSFEPVDGFGNKLTEIPFMFIGVSNNDPEPDEPPLYDMASLNLAHYRNSADYEESVFTVGQPTAYAAGITKQWYDEVLQGKLNFGSRGGIALPEGGSAGLIQMAANTAAFEAMEHKERQMVALGAKLVEQQTVQRTAQEARQTEASEASTLTTATKNVSAAFKWCLEWAAIFAGVMSERQDATSDVIKFELNTEFDFVGMTSDQIRMVLELWLKEAITFSEMRELVRKSSYATLDDDKARAEIEKDRPDPVDTGDLDPDAPPPTVEDDTDE